MTLADFNSHLSTLDLDPKTEVFLRVLACKMDIQDTKESLYDLLTVIAAWKERKDL